MSEAPRTQPSLLVRLGDPRDGPAWAQFVDIYAPLVYGFVRKQGLQDADAADLTQDVLRAVAGAIGRLRYDPARGSFRGWLFTIVRNKLRNFRTSAAQRYQGASNMLDLLAEQPAREQEAISTWELEYEQRLFDWAAQKVRSCFQDSTWQAFWRTAVEGQSPRDVAGQLGISPGAVYIARSRVLAKLRIEIQQIQAE